GALSVLPHEREMVRDSDLVETAWHLGQRVQRLDLRPKREVSSRAVMVIERLDAEVIAGTEQLPGRVVPDREGEVADEAVYARLTPDGIRSEDEFAIRQRLRNAEGGDQLGAVVDTRIGRDRQRAVGAREGEVFTERLLGGVAHSVSEADGAVRPHACPILPPMGHRLDHGPDFPLLDRRPVQTHQPGDGAHTTSGCTGTSGTYRPCELCPPMTTCPSLSNQACASSSSPSFVTPMRSSVS